MWNCRKSMYSLRCCRRSRSQRCWRNLHANSQRTDAGDATEWANRTGFRLYFFLMRKTKNAQRIGRAHFVIDSHIHIDAHPTHGGFTANGANEFRSRNTELEEIPEKRLQILFISLFFLFPFCMRDVYCVVGAALGDDGGYESMDKIINMSEVAISYACKSVSISWAREQAHMHGSPVNGKFFYFLLFCGARRSPANYLHLNWRLLWSAVLPFLSFFLSLFHVLSPSICACPKFVVWFSMAFKYV